MKKLLAVLFSFMTLTTATSASTVARSIVADAVSVQQNDYVEILYFHSKQRCATCIAIEKHTKEVLQKEYADELKKGKVKFRAVDISKKENEVLADKYEVTWSSLFVVKHGKKSEIKENMTNFAFSNARKKPDVFKSGLIKKIDQLLK